MLIVKAAVAPLVCLLVVACADERQSASDHAEVQTPPSKGEPVAPGSTAPATTSPSKLPVTTAPPATNRLALEKGLGLFANGGVRQVGEAEPPHGDTDANLTGQWGPNLVIATVRRTGDHMLDWEVVERQSIANVEVETIRGTFTFLRFPYGDFTVDLSVVGENDPAQFLPAETKELTGTILCPSECGDLPIGADG